MAGLMLVFVGAVFALAGLVKGVIGLGLPTISMGLLAVAMPPVHAAGILILPSLVTNFWQMLAGPSLGELLRRLWPMLLAICLGTWAGLGLMTGATARFGPGLLGIALVLYAIVSLAALQLHVPKRWELVVAPLVGLATGVTAAATGVFVIPSVPYLQAIGLERDKFVQALGLCFTVSTLALAVNIRLEGGLQVASAPETILALALAGAGMWLGQAIRRRMSPPAFRTWFFVGLLLLGIYLIGRSVV
jgi:uncharacterized protein